MISKRMHKSLEEGISIRDIFEEGKRLADIYGQENIFNFSIGNPSIEPPECVNNAMKEFIDNEPAISLHGYPSNVGHPDVRKCVADYLNKSFNKDYDTENIIMTSGAAAAIALILNAVLDIDDEVVSFAPYFWEYKNYVEQFYGKLIPAQCDRKTLQPDKATFEAAISERTKIVFVCSPNNPTGAVYTEESIQMIADVLSKKEKEYGHPIYIVSDEPYRLLAYDGIKVPYIPDYYRNTLVVYSYSKTLSIPGERIGYAAILKNVDDFEDLIAGITASMRWLGYVNAPSLQQKILLKCVDKSVDMHIYEKSRNLLYEGLTEIGYDCIHPDGAFYLFMRSLEPDDVKFCQRAKEEKILFAPGSAFYGPGFVRLSYCVPPEVIKNSLPGFKRLYDKYKK